MELVRSKNLFPDTIKNNIFDTKSSFHLKTGTTVEVQFQYFTGFLLALAKFSF